MVDLVLSQRTQNVVRAAIVLAAAHRSGQIRTLRSVAEVMGVSRGTASHVLGDLVRAGLVTSTLGARGGYRLARAPERVPLLAVVATGAGLDCGAGAVSWSGRRTGFLQALWADAGTRFWGPLEETTLAQLMDSEAFAGSGAGAGTGPVPGLCGVLPVRLPVIAPGTALR